jgi:L-2-hydroxyglutarate oxidase
MTDARFDVIVIGGGVVGLGTALAFTRRFPRLRLLVVEKEDGVARHQSGHNSGVIHSGIYYKPGSQKAKLCVQGAAEMVEFCRQQGIAHEVCGKVIVAVAKEELPRLDELQRRAQANGLAGVRRISPEELRELEPHCTGMAALHVPQTGITNYAHVCEKYAECIQAAGGEVRTGSGARAIARAGNESVVETATGAFATRWVVNCAGLHSDRVCRLAGYEPGIRIVPFRGEYYDLVPGRAELVRNLIYPVPDPRFPFLGVHFTRRITGTVDAGPNAVFALAREGYSKTSFSARDTLSALTYSGFWRMAARHWRSGASEMHRSWSKSAFVRALQALVPEVQAADLVPGGAGVRAQALQSDGALVDDFHFEVRDNFLHVLNVPSPAATASLAIGRAVVEMAAQSFRL